MYLPIVKSFMFFGSNPLGFPGLTANVDCVIRNGSVKAKALTRSTELTQATQESNQPDMIPVV